MRHRFLVASLALAGACVDNQSCIECLRPVCPDGETCSDKTPYGLHFKGSLVETGGDLAGASQYFATPIKGTLRIEVVGLPASQAFVVDDGGSTVLHATAVGTTITVTSMAEGDATLRIVDPETNELFDRIRVFSSRVSRVEMRPYVDESLTTERPPTTHTVYWAREGLQRGAVLRVEVFGPSIFSNEQHLIDDTMTVDIDGVAPEPAYTYPPATYVVGDRPAGRYTVNAHFAGEIETNYVTVVDGADLILPMTVDEKFIAGDRYSRACFSATNHGAYVYGLTWTYTPSNRAAFSDFSNCLEKKDDSLRAGDVVHVTATAGNITDSFDVPVVDAI